MKNAGLHVITNDNARRANRLTAVLDAVRDIGLDPVVHTPANGEEAREMAAFLATLGNDATVVAAGGDGTFHTVVEGLLGAGAENSLPSVAVWPLGTMNVTAGELGLTALSPAGLAALITDGDRLPVNVGRMTTSGGEHWFVQMASVGFDAEVVAAVPDPLKRTLGAASYAMQSVTALPGYTAPDLTVTIDGAVHSAQQVIVANGRLYGGDFEVAPAADLTAPSFQVCLLSGHRRQDLAVAGLRLLTGRFADGVTTITGIEVKVEADPDCAVQADGEVLGTTPVTCFAVSGLLRLVVPPG